ncbi:MAG: hypothetical protein AAF514_23200 [Verrucomicrobiota bacterium]
MNAGFRRVVCGSRLPDLPPKKEGRPEGGLSDGNDGSGDQSRSTWSLRKTAGPEGWGGAVERMADLAPIP